jgi:hypothetical protein
MKKALYLAFALLSATTAAIAQQGTPPAGTGMDGQSFEERKERMLKRMEARMQAMQKAHDCIRQAQDEKATRACGQGYRLKGSGGKAGGGSK